MTKTQFSMGWATACAWQIWPAAVWAWAPVVAFHPCSDAAIITCIAQHVMHTHSNDQSLQTLMPGMSSEYTWHGPLTPGRFAKAPS